MSRYLLSKRATPFWEAGEKYRNPTHQDVMRFTTANLFCPARFRFQPMAARPDAPLPNDGDGDAGDAGAPAHAPLIDRLCVTRVFASAGLRLLLSLNSESVRLCASLRPGLHRACDGPGLKLRGLLHAALPVALGLGIVHRLRIRAARPPCSHAASVGRARRSSAAQAVRHVDAFNVQPHAALGDVADHAVARKGACRELELGMAANGVAANGVALGFSSIGQHDALISMSWRAFCRRRRCGCRIPPSLGRVA
jgi:hypothetical protein